jgi:hypothetical protein
VRNIAWKAQTRLGARFRRLLAKVVAIAREIAAFLWAIARQVEPRLLPRVAARSADSGLGAIEGQSSCRARLEAGPRWGVPEQRLEASFVLMPVVRQGPAPDEYRIGGNQPAHQSMSTDVQQARLLPCTTLSTSGNHRQPGVKKSRSLVLKTDIRA